LFPVTALAHGIPHFRMDITVLENGDLHVHEMFNMAGNFNGMDRIINYRSNNTDGDSYSPTGSMNIYNGSGINLKRIMGVDFSSTANLQNITGDLFNEVNSALNGQYGVFTVRRTSVGETFRIFNHDRSGKAFYLEYILENMAAIHNDVGEVYLNLFTELTESVGRLEVYIHIPNNQKLLRVWGHGSLWGETEIIDINTLKVTIDNLDANTPISVRFLFDKDVISESNKMINIDAFDAIIAIETERAEIANQEREALRVRERTITIIIYSVLGGYLVGLGIILYNTYVKHGKEYKKELESEYYRDFPSDNSPSTVGYLIRKNINNNDLSAEILDLIRKKKISFEPLDAKNRNFKFKKIDTNDLTEIEEKLMKFLFFDKDANEITLRELQKKAKKNHESFLANHHTWKLIANRNAKDKNFYYDKGRVKAIGILYSILGIGGAIILMMIHSNILQIITIVLSILALIYFTTFTKRTEEGNIEYLKWMALRKFMVDFGTMNEKDLPDVMLWEKYLVYALTLGCADRLAKSMAIKVKELEKTGTTINPMFSMLYFNHLMIVNRTLNTCVNKSMSAANAARAAAASSNSSGGGFGGGFSGGGGFGGGGGGGGRF